MFLFRATHGKDLAGSSSFASQTTTAAGRHIVSNPIRSSKRYELTATSATSLNQAPRVRSCDRLAASNMAFGRQTRQSRAVDLRALEPGSIHGPGGVDRTIGHDRDGSHSWGRAA